MNRIRKSMIILLIIKIIMLILMMLKILQIKYLKTFLKRIHMASLLLVTRT